MARRSPRQQGRHDKGVKATADYYSAHSYKVEADIEGFDQPESINGRRPDVIAKKGNETIIVEVETKDSVEADKAQQKVFENYADSHKNVKFRTKIV